MSNLTRLMHVKHIKFYRIKPEPKYKPYSKVNPEWLGKGLKSIREPKYYVVISCVDFYENKIDIRKVNISLQEMFEEFTWLDDSPCGEVDND